MKINSREEKIKFLKGIQSGTIPIATIQPRLFRAEGQTIPNGGKCKWYINNKEVDQDTYKKEVVKHREGDKVEIVIDGMELDEWINFVNNKDRIKTKE